VISQGRLLADVPMADFVQGGTGTHVKVHSPQADRLRDLLRARGVAVRPCAQPDRLEVRGIAAHEAGRIAAEHGIAVYELATRHASLEEAYFELTGSTVEFGARTGDDQ
jgi:ABC-2 type transport system ATP-binding protein